MTELDLTFSVDEDQMGKIVTHELHSGGRARPVTNDNKYRFLFALSNVEFFICFFSCLESITYIIWRIFVCIHKFVTKQLHSFEVSEALSIWIGCHCFQRQKYI